MTIHNGTRPLDVRGAMAILLAAALFSWWLGLKDMVSQWVSADAETHSAATPNILLIVADDLGYNDTNAINREGLPTPSLAALAQKGVTFTRHYADSTCTPSRVGILTGRYPERSGFRPVGTEIPAEYLTIAETLGNVGYNTYLTGKWHAGEDRAAAWPQNKGFDSWFGFLNQWELAGETDDSGKGARTPTYINPMLRENGGALTPFQGHLTDILADRTIAKIREFRSRKEPWFVYHAFLAPHHPIQPAKRYRKRFPDTAEGQYQALVTQLDDTVGRILKAVDRENTLVIFVSDNGGTNKQRDNNYPFHGKKSEPLEGAYRTPLIISWPGKIQEGKFIDNTVMNVDLYPTIAATAQAPVTPGIDGENLWPLILNDVPLSPRSRSWETYSANVNALDYSYLEDTGDWRLSITQGLFPELFHLDSEPSGAENVAEKYPHKVQELTRDFWQSHWNNSLIPVESSAGKTEEQTLYTGFDAMRTPYRNGFAIGLELGPLAGDEAQVLAGQEGVWELRLDPNEGLSWHIGDTVLRDAGFDPNSCNPIILTGFFEEMGHLSVREPRSELKLYARQTLQAQKRAGSFPVAKETDLAKPTFINSGGTAVFANMMLSDWSDPYSPRIVPQFLDLYTTSYKDKKLSLSEIGRMSKMLCNQGV